MRFVLMRDKVVATKQGHFLRFEKGVPTFVPPQLWDDVLAAGGFPEEEIPEPTGPKTVDPTDPVERSGLIQAAIEIIATRNRREDFSAGGSPHAKVLSTELGFPVTPKERDVEWTKFMAGKDD